jgi:hypothetical protein
MESKLAYFVLALIYCLIFWLLGFIPLEWTNEVCSYGTTSQKDIRLLQEAGVPKTCFEQMDGFVFPNLLKIIFIFYITWIVIGLTDDTKPLGDRIISIFLYMPLNIALCFLVYTSFSILLQGMGFSGWTSYGWN